MQRIIQRIELPILMEQSRWMMRPVNKEEVIEWMKGVKATAPEQVFVFYCRLAKEELSQRIWLDVRARCSALMI